MAHHRIKNHTGFTLIELVVVIVIIGILSVLGGQFIVAPIQGYVDLSRRAKLVDQAEMALRRMQRDIRAALPNSIIEDGTSITMINTVAGGRYRRYPVPTADCVTDSDAEGCDFLNFTEPDDSFEVLGGLGEDPDNDHFEGKYLVIYNVTATGDNGNAYIDPVDDVGNRAEILAANGNQVTLKDFFKFENPSPYQRFFIVDNKVTYKCEGDELRRYVIDVNDSGDGPYTLVTRGIKDCEFTYEHGTTQRAGLVTLKLTLNDKEAEEETITLIHQVHVVNAP